MTKNLNNYMPAAIVLGLGVNGLGIVRSLGQQGVKVYGFFSDYQKEFGRFSKYVEPIHFDSEQDLLNKLIGLSKCESKPVLFCSSDKFTEVILKKSHLLCDSIRYCWEKKELYFTLMDKSKYGDLLDGMALTYPKTLCPSQGERLDALEETLREMRPPYIVKPTSTQINDLFGGEKNFIINDFSTAIEFLKENFSVRTLFVMQEIIPHDDEDIYYCTGYFDEEGKSRAIFSAQKIRQYLPKYGVTSYAISKELKIVREITETALKKMNYQGLFDIEFLYDKRDGDYKLIEVNPRTHLANSHSLACGINLPYIVYCDMTQLPYEREVFIQKNQICWIDLESDMGSFSRKFREGELSFSAWIISLLRVRACSVFSIDDLKPYVLNSMSLIKKILVRLVG